MNCPRCGRPLAAGAAFCMHCGQMVARPARAPGTPAGIATAVPDSEGKKKAILFAVIGAFAVLAILGGLMASGVLRFGAQQPVQKNLQASGTTPPPALVATGEPPPPNLQATGTKIVMPDDVRKWLEHLERIENRRMDMSRLQVAKAMEMLVALQAGGTLEMLNGLIEESMGGEEVKVPGPVKETTDTAANIRQAWQQLNQDFLAYPPPAECVPIRDQYDPVLRETGAMIGDVIGAVEGATENRDAALAALMGMQGKSKGIDKSAVDSDGLVQAICDKYETRKWFKITADVGGGLMQRGGF
ncbi:MAG TPA: zinc-ribbon domain-containing protein [Fimbriimonadaceae bacterium]|nr:zinc-ribbon domain-containing protein [Fimbriimonadaceae bacterium]